MEAYTKKKAGSIYLEQLALIWMIRDIDGVDLKELPTPIERKPYGIITEIVEAVEEVPIINFTFNQ